MLSRFCVLVCEVAQLTSNAVHAAAILPRKICFDCFMGCNACVDNQIFNECLESNPGSDLRAMQDSVETEIVLLKVTPECPVTNLSKDGTR